MALAPRGYTKKETAQAKQPVATGMRTATGTLDATTTVEVMRLGACSKVSYQSTGDLAGTVEFSISGLNWSTPVAFTATVMASYNTHNVDGIRVTRTGGSGQLFIVGT